jgi:hypothetical protein
LVADSAEINSIFKGWCHVSLMYWSQPLKELM